MDMDATLRAAKVLSDLAREWERKLSWSWRTRGDLPLCSGKDYSREYAIERVIDVLYDASEGPWDHFDRLYPTHKTLIP
jgi:hypothetical protein